MYKTTEGHETEEGNERGLGDLGEVRIAFP
jgi:hypothetical protein